MLDRIKNRKQEGFTIIEVLIVLAIAGLIMLIVFLAVPALQRSSRNRGREADASLIANAISSCLTNNNGNVDKCKTAYAATTSSGTTSSSGVSFETSKLNQLTDNPAYATDVNDYGTTKQAKWIFGARCDGSDATTTGASAREFAVIYLTENTSSTTARRCISS